MLDESYHHFLTPMVTLIPAMIIGTRRITFFQIIQCKKSYLARISILPWFKQHNNFWSYKCDYLFEFVTDFISLFFYDYFNDVTYRAAQNYANPVVWLMIIGFIGTIVFTTYMASSGMALLVYNEMFQLVLVASSLLLTFSTFRQLTNK